MHCSVYCCDESLGRETWKGTAKLYVWESCNSREFIGELHGSFGGGFSKSYSRSPSGMTTRRTTAKATAMAKQVPSGKTNKKTKAKCGVLRCAQNDEQKEHPQRQMQQQIPFGG
jgi:hypothetical protein